MRTLLFALLTALPALAEPRLADLSWMAGHWQGTVNGVEMEEVWLPPSGNVMPGLHRDRRGERTSFEFMRIAETDRGLVFFAQPGGRPPVEFPLVESTAERAVFANPRHDFPQRIVYWREGAKLCARVEGPPNDRESAEQWCWARK